MKGKQQGFFVLVHGFSFPFLTSTHDQKNILQPFLNVEEDFSTLLKQNSPKLKSIFSLSSIAEKQDNLDILNIHFQSKLYGLLLKLCNSFVYRDPNLASAPGFRTPVSDLNKLIQVILLQQLKSGYFLS